VAFTSARRLSRRSGVGECDRDAVRTGDQLDLVLNLRGTMAIGERRRYPTCDVVLVMPCLSHLDSQACCT
jgi:hypothetical protein